VYKSATQQKPNQGWDAGNIKTNNLPAIITFPISKLSNYLIVAYRYFCNMKHLRALNKYFWKYRWRLGFGVFFVVLSNYFNVLAPQLTGYVIDYVNHSLQHDGAAPSTEGKSYDVLIKQLINYITNINGMWNVVLLCVIVLIALALLKAFFLFLMRQTIIVMSRLIEYDQKNEVYRHYQQLDSLFYKRNSTGDLMNRITEDVSRVRMFTGPAIMYVVNLVTIIGFSVFFMFQRSPELTIYVLLPLPILAIIIYIVNQRIHKQSEVIQESLSALTTNAQESYAGIRVIKSFTQENTMLRFFTQNSEKYRQSAVGLAKVEALYFPAITLLIGLSTLLTIMIGGLYYINGTHNIGPGTIVEFVIYVNMLTFPVSAIGLTASMIQRAAASQKRLNEFLDTESAIKDQPLAKETPLKGDIIFNNITMRYPDTGIQALKHFNLHIKAGEKIAIFGRTGSGKTTLAQLLLRMYDPQEGHISVDGVDLREIKLASLRQQISYVPQDVFLFSDTIFNNIASGEANVTEEQVYNAAKQAGVHEEILRFPQQYQTIVGERGVTLSGGQKQRVSIARAIIKNPHILLFDDCLSAVDAKTESLITGHLNNYLQNKTAIIITHRIFASLEFDKIFVLDEGVVIEQGTHEQLLQIPNGYYAALYQQQKKG